MRPPEILRDSLLNLFYPRSCELCGASVERFADGAVCANCWRKSEIFDGRETICHKCGRILRNSVPNPDFKTFCHRCDGDFFDLARSVGVYNDALRVCVLELKEKPFVPEKLKNLLHIALAKFPLEAATKIVPVPLHEKRLRERGFNQAAVLARILGKKSKLQILENCLVREVYTEMHRGAVDERARRESAEKAFAVKQPRNIENAQILLVDDVFTSGATVSACAETLKKNGAREVFVITIARAA